MYAVIKFKGAEKVAKFEDAVYNAVNWRCTLPLNSNVTGCVRLLDFNSGGKRSQALYDYLLKLGAFEEVELK